MAGADETCNDINALHSAEFISRISARLTIKTKKRAAIAEFQTLPVQLHAAVVQLRLSYLLTFAPVPLPDWLLVCACLDISIFTTNEISLFWPQSNKALGIFFRRLIQRMTTSPAFDNEWPSSVKTMAGGVLGYLRSHRFLVSVFDRFIGYDGVCVRLGQFPHTRCPISQKQKARVVAGVLGACELHSPGEGAEHALIALCQQMSAPAADSAT